MKRVTHRLRENASLERPRLKVFLDTEAHRQINPDRSEEQTLAFGWLLYEDSREVRGKALNRKEWHRFDTAAQCWALLEDYCQRKMVLYVYAHNWDYDAALIQMQTQAELGGWKMLEYVRSSHFMWAKFKRDKHTILFVDTINYFAMPLAVLGESMDVAKLTMPEMDDTPEAWDIYCRRDVEVLQQAVDNLIAVVNEHDLGNFAKTAAGQAFNAFKHHYMEQKPLILNDGQVSALERAAYYGGKVEVFNRAEQRQHITCLDVNSMYPYVMRFNEFPYEKHLKARRASLEQIREVMADYDVVALCYLDVQNPVYPRRIDSILCFPTGQFWSTLTTPEIRHAMAAGELLEVGHYVSYKRAPLFQDFVRDLYALRRGYENEGNKAFATACKLLLNSLYGKFGQRGRRWVICSAGFDHTEAEFIFDCQHNGFPLAHRERFGRVLHEVRDEEAFDSLPVVAAHVTAYARLRLSELIDKAGREHVYYCDTDSIFVDDVGLSAVRAEMDSTALGALKIEGEAEYAWFQAPKFYQFGQKHKRKGVRASARELAADTFEQPQFESYDRALARGVDGSIHVAAQVKHYSMRYRKGDTLPDGTVRPFALHESREDYPGLPKYAE